MNTTHTNRLATCLLALLVVGASLAAPASAQTQTEIEVAQTIQASTDYINANLIALDDYSMHGALEFWSSGGLLHEIPAAGRGDEFDAINVAVRHIQVTALVEGQAAVAHYYLEGTLTPKGAAPVGHYLTRVTQTFVKEGGAWKIRSSHWSPITGGSGSSQTSLID